MIYIGTGITENYYEKAKPFLQSLNGNSKQNNFAITVDWVASKEIQAEYPNIHFIYQNSEPIKGELTETKCLQHGAFLDVFECNDNDIIVFSDSDCVVQRDFTKLEIELLNSLWHKEIMINYNNINGMTLKDEYNILIPTVYKHEFKPQYPVSDLSGVCYNTGSIIANLGTWKDLRANYSASADIINKMFRHYARQQFLISVLINKWFNVLLTPLEIHAHGHWEIPKEVYLKDGKYQTDKNLVMFAHNLKV